MLPTKFQFIWESGFRGEDFFRNQPIKNKNGLWWPCLLTDRDEMSTINRGLSIDASYQVSVHLPKWFQSRRFLNIFPIGSFVKTMSADGGHLGWRFGSLDIILKVDHLCHVCFKLAYWFQRTNCFKHFSHRVLC